MTSEPSYQYGVIPPDVLKTLSGFEMLDKMLKGELPHPPMSEILDFHLHEVKEGRVTFKGHGKEQFYNPLGMVHGGYMMTMLDSCMTCAAQTLVERGRGFTTLEAKVNFIRPVLAECENIYAIGSAIHCGRRTGTASGEVRDDKGVLYAHGTTTIIVL